VKASRSVPVGIGTSTRGRPTDATTAGPADLENSEETRSCSTVVGFLRVTGPGSNEASTPPGRRTARPANARPPARREARYSATPERPARTASAATVPCPQAGNSPSAVKNRSDTSLLPTETNTACEVPMSAGKARRSFSVNEPSDTTTVGLPPTPSRTHARTITGSSPSRAIAASKSSTTGTVDQSSCPQCSTVRTILPN